MGELAEKMIEEAKRTAWVGYIRNLNDEAIVREMFAQALRTMEQHTGGEIMNSFTPQCLAKLASQIEGK